MKRYICSVIAAAALLIGVSVPATSEVHPSVRLVSPVQDKNFYFLSLIERTRQVSALVKHDPEFTALYRARLKAIKSAEKNCVGEAACTIDSFMWTEDEILRASRRFRQLFQHSSPLRSMVAGPMRSSGLFELYRQQSDEDLLIHAWTDSTQGIDHILEVYGKQLPPHYPHIDAGSLPVNSPAYWTTFHSFVASLASTDQQLFFSPSLGFSVRLLAANHRDEPGRFEPMEAGTNALPFRYIGKVDWDKYPYGAILVPGDGPNDADTALTSGGRRRVELAAQLFHQGQAPILIVSGGFVHPAYTRFCEAVEMRRSLIEDFNVPAEAVILEPFARHTTTNFRNAARLIYRYGIPFDKRDLVVAESRAIDGIVSSKFDERNQRELGFSPAHEFVRVSPTAASFLPAIESLQADSRDPLDP